MEEIKIEKDFRDLIPPLTDSELEGLHASLEDNGCMEKLIVWEGQGLLLDGHNRYKYCSKFGIPFETRAIPLPSREAAMNFIILNQLGRRNLSPRSASILRGKLYSVKKASKGGDHKSKGNSCTLIDTAEAIGKETGVSPRTVKNDGQFAEAVKKLGVEKDVMSGKDKRSKKEIINAARGKRKEPIPKYEPALAEEFATMAMAQLERISDNDINKETALKGVIEYCNKRLR